MGCPVVGCQEEQIVVFSHLFIEKSEQACKVAVQLQVRLVGMCSPCAPLVSYDVGLRVAYAQHICGVALSQFLTLDGSYRHVRGYRSAQRRESDILSGSLNVLVLCQQFVLLFYPLRQVVTVIGACYETQVLSVEPVGAVGTASGGEDGGTVLVGHAYHLRLKIGMQTQLVADGGGKKVLR